VYCSALKQFLGWLNLREEWVGAGPKELLLRHVESRDQYLVLDLLQQFLNELDRRRKYKQMIYAAVRSFFMHNRCGLPHDPAFKVQAKNPPVKAMLTLSHVSDIVKNANLRDRSIILVKWMGMLDNARTVQVGANLAENVVSQIRRGEQLVKLDVPKRKTNEQPFYAFIGKDAIDALREYFEKERGWPKAGEPIWLLRDSRKGKPLTTTAMDTLWLRLLRRMGVIPKKSGPLATRYGYNSHEMRDIAKTLLHTYAKKDGFDMDCAEFWLGHTVDPLGYDKFFQNQEYVRSQYMIAERYLNIISNAPATQDIVKRYEDKYVELMQKFTQLETIVQKIGQSQREETLQAVPANIRRGRLQV
jgi:hypothetical protein